MGDPQKNIDNYNNKNFVFYSNSKHKNSFMDFFIIYHCEFFVAISKWDWSSSNNDAKTKIDNKLFLS